MEYAEHGARQSGPRDAHLATCEADDDGDLNAVVTVGPAALLLLWRGYADQARRTRPAPRFHAARRLLAETLSPLPLAKGGHLGAVAATALAVGPPFPRV